MKLAQILMLVTVLAPRLPVYVKGHSQAAKKVRENLEAITCYSGGEPEKSTAILHVDHLMAQSRRSWVVIFLTDLQDHVLWQGKAEEYPWPIPSPLNRLLRNMAKSTCRQVPAAQSSSETLSHPQLSKDSSVQPNDAPIQHSPN